MAPDSLRSIGARLLPVPKQRRTPTEVISEIDA